MRYVHVPTSVASREVFTEDCCFSPGRFTRFIPPEKHPGTRFVSLDKIVVVRNEFTKADKLKTYRYAEIGDIDVQTGGVDFRSVPGHALPTDRPQRVYKGDVLISTVRTYRKGIGTVTEENGDDLVATAAILTLKGVSGREPSVSLPYVHAFLRADFFVEQVWALLHRGVYPRMDGGALGRILLPVSNNPQACRYVAALSNAIAAKDSAIRKRHKEILTAVADELLKGGGQSPFVYSYPTSKEVQSSLRFDTGLYCRGFRAFRHMVENYRHGSTTLSKLGVRSRRGPNLAVTVIGKSLYSNEPRENWYELVRPVNISEFGTVGQRQWLGNRRQLPTVAHGDLILGCEGFEKGRTLVVLDEPERLTTNFHGTVLSWPGADIEHIIWLRCVLAYLRESGVIDWVGVGGSGGHMSPEYFDQLPIPNFPDSVRRRISKLYHCDTLSSRDCTIDELEAVHDKRNRELGIWELAADMRELQLKLDILREEIIWGRQLNLPVQDLRRSRGRT